jgi:hypothetical protein
VVDWRKYVDQLWGEGKRCEASRVYNMCAKIAASDGEATANEKAFFLQREAEEEEMIRG